MNDLTAVKLILESLEHSLEAGEQADLESYLAESPQTRQFAEWVQQIENSLAQGRGIEQSGQMGPGLSDVTRARVEQALKKAVLENWNAAGGGEQSVADDQSGRGEQSGNWNQKVAESDDTYPNDPPDNSP